MCLCTAHGSRRASAAHGALGALAAGCVSCISLPPFVFCPSERSVACAHDRAAVLSHSAAARPGSQPTIAGRRATAIAASAFQAALPQRLFICSSGLIGVGQQSAVPNVRQPRPVFLFRATLAPLLRTNPSPANATALPPPRPSACAFPAPSSPRGAPACVPPAHQARHQASWLHHFVRVTTMHSRSFLSTDCWRTSTAAGPTRAARRAPSSWGATIVPRSRGCVRRRLNHHGRRERLFGELDRLDRCQSRLSGRGANSLNVARHFSTHGELDRLGGEVQHGTVTKNRFVLRSCSGDFSRLPTVLNRIRWCL